MFYKIKDGKIEVGKSFKLVMDNGDKLRTKNACSLLQFLGVDSLYLKALNAVLHHYRVDYLLANKITVDFSVEIRDVLSE